MKNIKRLWIVTYKLDSVIKNKVRFCMYEDDFSGEKEYIIQNEIKDESLKVNKKEGNDYFKSLLEYDKKAIVNKII